MIFIANFTFQDKNKEFVDLYKSLMTFNAESLFKYLGGLKNEEKGDSAMSINICFAYDKHYQQGE